MNFEQDKLNILTENLLGKRQLKPLHFPPGVPRWTPFWKQIIRSAERIHLISRVWNRANFTIHLPLYPWLNIKIYNQRESWAYFRLVVFRGTVLPSLGPWAPKYRESSILTTPQSWPMVAPVTWSQPWLVLPLVSKVSLIPNRGLWTGSQRGSVVRIDRKG